MRNAKDPARSYLHRAYLLTTLRNQFLLPSATGGTSESTWVDDHDREAITSVDYRFSVASVHGNSSRVDVDTLKTQDTAGCHTFSSYYLMSRSGGAWKIEQVFLTEGGC